MKYRVNIDISFDKETDAQAVLDAVVAIKNKIYKNIGTEKFPIEVKANYHKCYHDESNTKPCDGYVFANLT